MPDGPRSPGSPPEPDHPGDEGIQAEAPRPTPGPQPAADDELILLGDEHIQANPPTVRRQAPPTPPSKPKPPPLPATERSTELFDREFAIDIGRPWTGFVFACLVFAGMAVASVVSAGLPGLLCVAGYFGLLAVSCIIFFLRSRTRRLRFTEDGVEITRPAERLLYNEILEIYAPDRTSRSRRNFAIHLLHADGQLTIPPSVAADSRDLLEFLESQPLGVREIPKVDPVLRDFLKQQVAVHGAEQVYVYRARRTPAQGAANLSALWCAAAFVALGIGVCVLGIMRHAEAAIAIGIGTAFVGGLISLLVGIQHKIARTPIKAWQKATLVIGPDGLALMQGTLTGELRWRELKSVKMGNAVAGAVAGGPANARIAGIQLQVAGATIAIADIYHWPLTHALDQIERHWEER